MRTNAYAKVPEQTALIEAYDKLVKPLAERVVGLTASLAEGHQPAGETALGDVIADAQLAATRREDGGAEIAFTNPGGIRTELH